MFTWLPEKKAENMKVVFVMTGLGVLPGRENNVSGHIQIPVKTAEIFLRNGHDVTLITTSQSDGSVVPAIVPDGLKIVQVTDGRRRSALESQEKRNGYKLISFVKQLKETVVAINESNADIVHVFGFERMARYAGLISIFCSQPVVVSILGGTPMRKFGFLYNRVKCGFTLTQSVLNDWANLNVRTELTRPGVGKPLNMHQESTPRDIILFWREASFLGGADICLQAFSELAEKHTDLKFVFAVRNHTDEVADLERVFSSQKNMILYRFPYEGDITLEKLIGKSIVAVLPFRKLSIEPQMTIMETLALGCPVICTSYRSTGELVVDESNGYLLPDYDVVKLKCAIECAIRDKQDFSARKEQIQMSFSSKWNWDKYFEIIEKRYFDVFNQS